MSVPLSEYVSSFPITRRVAPPGYLYHQGIALTPEFQKLMRLLLELLPDRETNIRWFRELNAGNIKVNSGTGIPSLDVVWTNYDANLARKNYARVEEILSNTILPGALLANLPPDFQGLLHLMRTDGHVYSYAIQNHCSLVRSRGKINLFLPLYNHLLDILQWENPPFFGEVMNSLDFPQGWRDLIQYNQYLARFYGGGVYVPWRREHPCAPVLRFMRNTYSHPLKHAWDKGRMQRMYTEGQLVEMMETVLPLLLHSLQMALDRQGLLREIETES